MSGKPETFADHVPGPHQRGAVRRAHVRRVRAKSIRIQAPVLVAGLKRLGLGLAGQAIHDDDRLAMLEAVELIERMLEFVPDADAERGRA